MGLIINPYRFSVPITYRYWKWNFTAIQDGSELIILAAQLMIGGVDQVPTMTSGTTSGVTVSATTSAYGTAGWKAFDDSNADTLGWDTGTTSVPQSLKVDFGSGNEKHIESYSLSDFATGGFTYAPSAWTLQGSNDDSSYTTVDSQSSVSWSINQTKNFTIPSY